MSFVDEYRKRRRIVDSKQNSTIKTLRRAFANGELTEDGCVAIEGWNVISETARLGIRFKTLVVQKSLASAGPAMKLLAMMKSDVDVIEVTDEILRSAVDTESPQGVAALVYFPQFPTLDELLKPQSLLVVAEGIQDPGNLGTIIRS